MIDTLVVLSINIGLYKKIERKKKKRFSIVCVASYISTGWLLFFFSSIFILKEIFTKVSVYVFLLIVQGESYNGIFCLLPCQIFPFFLFSCSVTSYHLSKVYITSEIIYFSLRYCILTRLFCNFSYWWADRALIIWEKGSIRTWKIFCFYSITTNNMNDIGIFLFLSFSPSLNVYFFFGFSPEGCKANVADR